MPKTKVVYACEGCGAESLRWSGQCGECKDWNTMVEVSAPSLSSRSKNYAGANGGAQPLGSIAASQIARKPTHNSELDRVLGGGLVPGAVMLIGGDPGIGKSTLLLQTMASFSQEGSVLYVSGEESPSQVAARAKRLGLNADSLLLLPETRVEAILAIAAKEKPAVMVIDSIQTMHLADLPAAPGGITQVRESAATLARYAKQNNVAIFLVGHVTKSGEVAGPRVLEHIVDTVIYMEGQSDGPFRLMRSVKNRFGSANELGVFAMTEQGLKPVTNPSAIFLSRPTETVSGSAVMVVWEGTRPILVEVQALLDETHLPTPRRVTLGLEQNRLSMLLAVLHRHAGLFTSDQDVFVNVVGGVRVSETSVDLALIAAVVSSLKNTPIDRDCVIFGEVGLSGEIRPVPNGQARLQEAAKHGFKQAIVPESNAPKKAIPGMKVTGIKKLKELVSLVV